MAQHTNKTPSFTDGHIKIYSAGNGASAGDKPTDSLTYKVTLSYEERTVGLKRFWEAQAFDVSIQRLIRCPYYKPVSSQDIAVGMDGKQYKIVQLQVSADQGVKVMDLSLERIEKIYDIG
jgi:hypothetical protein